MSFIDAAITQASDPIFGLTEEFRSDTSTSKVNLGAGVYQSDDGNIFEEEVVRQVASKLTTEESSKNYLSIGGSPGYCTLTAKVLFGSHSPVIKNNCLASIQTPGGTGALRIAAELLFKNSSTNKEVYVSNPTWPNHQKIFGKDFGAGFSISSYPYYNFADHSIEFESLLSTISSAKKHSIILLHLSCHNPTGLDLNKTQWTELAECLKTKQLIPVVDCAYQGFADRTEDDRLGLDVLIEKDVNFLAAQSFSKTFTLYGERAGALHVVCSSEEDAKKIKTNLLAIARPIYSNPPLHGGKVVETILSSDELASRWDKELNAIRERINYVRAKFCDLLQTKRPDFPLEHIRKGKGMFSLTGLDLDKINLLKSKYHVYMTNDGRICLAALNSKNLEYVVDSISSVLAD